MLLRLNESIHEKCLDICAQYILSINYHVMPCQALKWPFSFEFGGRNVAEECMALLQGESIFPTQAFFFLIKFC